MDIGDLVVPIGNAILASGCGRYDCAVVANVDPFVLVSTCGSMLWTQADPYSVKPLVQVNLNTLSIVTKRYNRYKKEIEKFCASNGVVLKRCRVCGRFPKESQRGFGYTSLFKISCGSCFQSGPEREEIGKAVSEWNKQQTVRDVKPLVIKTLDQWE